MKSFWLDQMLVMSHEFPRILPNWGLSSSKGWRMVRPFDKLRAHHEIRVAFVLSPSPRSELRIPVSKSFILSPEPAEGSQCTHLSSWARRRMVRRSSPWSKHVEFFSEPPSFAEGAFHAFFSFPWLNGLRTRLLALHPKHLPFLFRYSAFPVCGKAPFLYVDIFRNKQNICLASLTSLPLGGWRQFGYQP